MGMTFDQAMNKVQNYKIVTRSSWSNGQYLHLLQNMTLIYKVYPSNIQNPLTPYQLDLNDFNATDWIEVT